MSKPPGSPRLSSTGRASCSRGEDPQQAVGGDQVEIGHAASEQRVSLAEVVMNVQTRHHRGESFARLVHAEELGNGVAQCWTWSSSGEAGFAPSCCAARGRRPGGARHGRYPAGLSGAVWLTTWASFHPRFTASCTLVLRPCPPTGLCTCAASPASNTRRSR